jgi:hypothetical protein
MRIARGSHGCKNTTRFVVAHGFEVVLVVEECFLVPFMVKGRDGC